MSDQWDQAKLAYRYYFKGDRTIAWDPASRKWVPVNKEEVPDSTPPLSARTRLRIGKIQQAEKEGLLSHDAAEAEILQIL
jgi:hypothetical protein